MLARHTDVVLLASEERGSETETSPATPEPWAGMRDRYVAALVAGDSAAALEIARPITTPEEWMIADLLEADGWEVSYLGAIAAWPRSAISPSRCHLRRCSSTPAFAWCGRTAPSSAWRASGRFRRAGRSPVERLEFAGDGGAAFLLTCRVYPEGERRVLLGDALTLTDSEVLRSMSRLNGEVVNLGRELERKNRELQHAMDEIKVLRGILPICMFCKKIRDDSGCWRQLETYIAEHSEAMFRHGLCANCAEEHYP
jgi:hypothetical protein